MARTDAAVVNGVVRGLRVLPPALRLVVVVAALLLAMGGCTAAWIDFQSYTPSPNICRADEIGVRADCVAPLQVPSQGAVR